MALRTINTECKGRYPALPQGCALPNHGHLVLRPQADGELSRFVGWLTLTHAQRWHANYHTVGAGCSGEMRAARLPVRRGDVGDRGSGQVGAGANATGARAASEEETR